MGERRLLVLGAGRHQKGMIQRAESRGIRVIAVDNRRDSPGKRLAAHSELVDALDAEAVLDVAERYRIDGITTCGTDLTVPVMALIAERLRLPSYISAENGRVATDKVLMSTAFDRVGARRPRSVEIGDDTVWPEVSELRMPVVVKPADSQGQRATTRIDEAAGLPQAVTAARRESRTGRSIVEEYIEGLEVTASAWVNSGRVRLLAVTDRITYNPPPAIGICFQHVYPSRWAETHTEMIQEQVQRVAQAYEMATGPLYVQMIVTDDEVFVIEAGARVGGGHESSLIPIVSGVDVIDPLIDLAMDGACGDVGSLAKFDTSAALVCFLLAAPGQVASLAGMGDATDSGLIAEGEFYVDVGHTQHPIVDSLGRVGYFVAVGSDRVDLDLRTRKAYASLSMTSVEGREMLFWPEDHVQGSGL